MWHDVHAKCHEDLYRRSSNIKVSPQKFEVMSVLLTRGFMMYGVEMASCGMILLPSSMKIGKDVEEILRFCLSNLTVCNVGITNRNL
jgi:hypothetical protein